MNRGLTMTAAGAALIAAAISGGISGCSKDKTTSAPASAPAATQAPAQAPSQAGVPSASIGTTSGGTKVIVDGKDQNVTGSVVCTKISGTVSIGVGQGATGIAAVLTDGEPPQVKSVGLGNVNGVTLGYAQGAGQGSATATKDGNTYKITGTATGVDMANPMQPVNKPFELDVTCSG
jgi:lipoprotein LpqH